MTLAGYSHKEFVSRATLMCVRRKYECFMSENTQLNSVQFCKGNLPKEFGDS